jgi:adenylosuccinate synthase
MHPPKIPNVPANSKAIVVVDLGFGDAGKGTIVDCLTRETGAGTVVRFNGGPQAGHNVVTGDGRHHTFSQFGSGSFVPGTRTVLAKNVLIEPYAMLREADHLAGVGVPDALDRLDVDARCRVITPVHVAANRLRERARGTAAHGTCGMGVGEAVADSLVRPDLTLTAADLTDTGRVVSALRALQQYKMAALRADGITPAVVRESAGRGDSDAGWDLLTGNSWFDAAVDQYRAAAAGIRVLAPSEVKRRLDGPGVTIFEGAQGVLLDEDVGFHPHTTWSSTTTFAAGELLRQAGVTDVRRVGVLRTYATRHGNGPMVTEDASLKLLLPEPHNTGDGRQGRFRVGLFDAVALRYALRCSPVDELAVTHVDRLAVLPAVACDRYERSGFGVTGDGEIKLMRPMDFASRERQTRTLLQTRPAIGGRPADPDGWLAELSARTGLPIGIVSTGPTADDKRRLS